MTLMKIYLIIFTLLLSLFGCGDKYPVPKLEEKKVLSSSTKKSNTQSAVHERSTFYKENTTEENETTRVFINCFTTGSIHIHKSCKNKIDMFLKSISLKNKRNIIIEVHTDKGGSQKNNLGISKKRAKNIASSLYFKEYKNSEVYYKGFGKSKLIYDIQSKKADIENRRVVVKLRSKNFKLNTKEYTLFVKVKKLKRKVKKQPSKKQPSKKLKKEKLDILS
ncbi:hypothetical protein MNB_SM-4-917 [hydrothermal vent metagenome]|uniref:OmpA-like domain-containing protein n=1 Tax=hydrothermal vent metagenome TaxID=652676 RepID=A0A1W1CW86_9ZZZZ